MKKKRKKIEKRGVNPNRIRWKRYPSNKQKWVDHPVYVRSDEIEKKVNPTRRRRNSEVISPVGGNQRKGGASSSRIRRKQETRYKRVDRRARRWRYGGKGSNWKKEIENYKKERVSEKKKKIRVKGWRKTEREDGVENHRRAREETRVDRRRWRSGRVESVCKAKERVEKGKVRRRNTKEHKTKCDSVYKRRKEGIGRQVEKETWKERKKGRQKERGDKQNRKSGRPYVQVDYVSGSRVLVRVPKTNEVRVGKGTGVSKYNEW